ncbi:PTS sugar transporter subunit IIA [Enterococcus alishanensis]
MIDESLVVLDSPLDNKASIIEFLSEKAKRLNYLENKDNYLEAVNHREDEFSTAVGFDVSIPHGKSVEVRTPFVCFMRTKDQIQWDEDGNSVRLVFLLGVPEEQKSKLHLKILAEISRRLMDEQFRAELINGDKRSILALLNNIENNIIK